MIQAALARPIKISTRLISYVLCAKYGDYTGLLLDERTIITAAHCQEEIQDADKDFKGLQISTQNILRTRRKYTINEYTLYTNPLYNSETRLNDLMIIKLEDRFVQFSKKTPPPPSLITDDSLEEEFWLEGFGNKRGRRSHKVPLSLYYLEAQSRLQFKQTKRLKPACFGDSGGPTYVRRPNGEVELAALLSGVGKTNKSRLTCSSKHYSLNTWLYPHLEWIHGLLAP